MEKFKVPVSMLAPMIDPGHLGFEDTSELEPLTEIIGQERAVEALEFGLGMKNRGNIERRPTGPAVGARSNVGISFADLRCGQRTGSA